MQHKTKMAGKKESGFLHCTNFLLTVSSLSVFFCATTQLTIHLCGSSLVSAKKPVYIFTVKETLHRFLLRWLTDTLGGRTQFSRAYA